MGGEVEILKAKLRDCRADNDKLMAQNGTLRGVIVALQNDIFQKNAQLRLEAAGQPEGRRG